MCNAITIANMCQIVCWLHERGHNFCLQKSRIPLPTQSEQKCTPGPRCSTPLVHLTNKVYRKMYTFGTIYTCVLNTRVFNTQELLSAWKCITRVHPDLSGVYFRSTLPMHFCLLWVGMIGIFTFGNFRRSRTTFWTM